MQVDISLELPENVAAHLAQEGDISSELKEAMGVELYRQEKITHFQLSQLLGVDRFETDGILKKHGVMIELTPEEFRNQVLSLREITCE